MLGLGKHDGGLKRLHTDKNFLIVEQHRLIKEFGIRMEESSIRLCEFLSNSHPFNFHPDDRVSINDIIKSPDIILVGKVFLCRTVTPCIKILSLLTVVEVPDADLKDKAVFLSLYNYQHPLDEKQEMSIPIFPEGTILAVANPTFFQAANYQIYTLRCDNPADVFVLSQSQCEHSFPGLHWPAGKSKCEDLTLETEPPKVKDWKSVGHYWLEKKNYVSALQAYSLALERDREDTEALTLRCSMFLHLKLYQKSLVDATELLDRNPLHKEAICHNATALIYLSQYPAAIEFLNHHINQVATSVDDEQDVRLKKLIEKAKTWGNQHKHGEYDLLRMLRCGVGYNHDCADYIGNAVEQNVPGKGRGMIAKENIKCGELIIGVKAYEIATIAGKSSQQNYLIDTETKMTRSRAIVSALMSIAHRMILDPDFAKAVYNFYDGTEALSNLNSNNKECKYIDLNRISAIFSLNAYSDSVRSADGETFEDIVGIWPIASLFNHGCFESNSTWKICGNVMFVRASRDIMKGEEITLLYYPYTTEYSDRVDALSKYNFVCRCRLCLLDSEDPMVIRNRRRKILQDLHSLAFIKPPRYSQFSQLIVELQRQRRGYPELNVYVIHPMIKLSQMYTAANKHLIAAEILRNVLKLTMKTVLIQDSFKCCLDSINAYKKCEDVSNAKICARSMIEILIQKYGIYTNELLEYIKPDLAETTILLEAVLSPCDELINL